MRDHYHARRRNLTTSNKSLVSSLQPFALDTIMTLFSSRHSLNSVATLLFTLCVVVTVSGCVHRIPIQQGNFLEPKDIDRVTTGMTRVQVRALLGTPMIADPFHQLRWDYYYFLKTKQMSDPLRQHFIVHFDDQDKVARIERLGTGNASSVPASEESDPAPTEQATIGGQPVSSE